MESRKGYVTVEEGVRLYYQKTGQGAGTLVAPGACLLAADLEPLAAGREVIFYDSRGRGGSDPPSDPWQIWTRYEVDDLESLRRAFGLEKISLFGWSYLGGFAALYAMEHPDRVRRLVLVSPIPPRFPAPYLDPESEQRISQGRIGAIAFDRLALLQEAGFEETDPVAHCREYHRVLLPRVMGNPAALARMRSDPCIYPNEWPRNIAAHWQAHFPDPSWIRDWREALHSLDIPTLVVHGMDDLIPLESSQEWVESLPDARLLPIPGAGHLPHLEAPELFFPEVNLFLQGE